MDVGFYPLAPACRIPDNDRRSYSRSCGRCQTPCKVPPSPRRLAGEPQTAVFHPLPNTPSKASFPPLLRGESVTYVSGTMCYLCLRSVTFASLHGVLCAATPAHGMVAMIGHLFIAVVELQRAPRLSHSGYRASIWS